MIEPVRKDAALVADIQAASADLDTFHLWWLGQSGFLVKWQARYLLFDPYLSDTLTRKYADTDKPHVRMTELAVSPSRLGFVDVATSSHNHTDHLDAETLLSIRQANPDLALVIPEANRAFVAERLGTPPTWPIGLDAGRSTSVAGFEIHAVPAAHEELETDAAGRHHFLGYVAQFGRWTIYHSGDTVRYEGMAETLKRWRIDVALLPINGRAPERRVAGNLSGSEAATLASDIGAQLVIPCHYEMFEFNTASPETFTMECERRGQAYKVLRCGERWSA